MVKSFEKLGLRALKYIKLRLQLYMQFFDSLGMTIIRHNYNLVLILARVSGGIIIDCPLCEIFHDFFK
jgi:hypothetical protein